MIYVTLFFNTFHMYQALRNHLSLLINTKISKLVASNLIGLEREALRVTPHGIIAQTPHPTIFGCKSAFG
ncbi:hypothetical protein TI04_10340 [Achromatium sp. WMS2]|nr:hypothetical protein TI04_10340 [Achromatium sp. WMS2]